MLALFNPSGRYSASRIRFTCLCMTVAGLLMSGLTQNELHRLMAAYRNAGRSRQIWATLTPFSEKWPLEHLLNELQAEERAMKNARPE